MAVPSLLLNGLHIFLLAALILVMDQMGWLNVESTRLPFWEIGESECCGFQPWTSETNGFKIHTFKPMTLKYLALLG